MSADRLAASPPTTPTIDKSAPDAISHVAAECRRGIALSRAKDTAPDYYARKRLGDGRSDTGDTARHLLCKRDVYGYRLDSSSSKRASVLSPSALIDGLLVS